MVFAFCFEIRICFDHRSSEISIGHLYVPFVGRIPKAKPHYDVPLSYKLASSYEQTSSPLTFYEQTIEPTKLYCNHKTESQRLFYKKNASDCSHVISHSVTSCFVRSPVHLNVPEVVYGSGRVVGNFF
jgi:hypothetical protein